jgi:hypothetical protein
MARRSPGYGGVIFKKGHSRACAFDGTLEGEIRISEGLVDGAPIPEECRHHLCSISDQMRVARRSFYNPLDCKAISPVCPASQQAPCSYCELPSNPKGIADLVRMGSAT